MDQHIKIWSLKGELWGDIVIVGDDPVKRWSFPYNWAEVRDAEKETVVQALKALEPATSYNKEAIEYEDLALPKVSKAPAKAQNKDQDIVPKRSLIDAYQLARNHAINSDEERARQYEAQKEEEDRIIVKPFFQRE